MNIWVDANGWPIPPAVLLGCLVAEILYFRGWRVLVKAEQGKGALTPTDAINRADCHPEPFASLKGKLREGPVSISREMLCCAQHDSLDAKELIHAPQAPLRVPTADEYQWNSWFWRGTYFLGAVIAFLLASSAPIDILSSRLLWVHMVQHLLLLVVIAPLLVAGAPLLPLWLGLPSWARRLVKRLKAGRAFYRVGKWLRQPAISCALLITGIWAWHWPTLYDLALTNGVIHDWCEHATFLAVSFLFWTQVIPSPPLHPRLGYLGRIGCVGIAIVQNVVLAALIGFAQTPLYAPYAHLAQGPGGLSALLDQRLGAGIMWTFGDLSFGIAFAVLVHQWLTSQSDDESIAIQLHHNAGSKRWQKTEA